jgi:hypothetical protein
MILIQRHCIKTNKNRINADWQFCCALLPAGSAERYASKAVSAAISKGKT